MDTQQIRTYMLKDPYIRQYYGGVLAVNQLPVFVDKPTIFIVNTDPLPGKGIHWITLYMDTVCEHFDSAGYQPRPDFKNYLIAKGPNYMFNNNRLQDFDTDTCRKLCLMYAYFRCRGFSFEDIISMFKDNLALNELIVNTFYDLTKCLIYCVQFVLIITNNFSHVDIVCNV